MPDRPKLTEVPDRSAALSEHEQKMKEASGVAQKLGKGVLGAVAQDKVQREAEKGMLIRRTLHTGEPSKKLASPMNSTKE